MVTIIVLEFYYIYVLSWVCFHVFRTLLFVYFAIEERVICFKTFRASTVTIIIEFCCVLFLFSTSTIDKWFFLCYSLFFSTSLKRINKPVNIRSRAVYYSFLLVVLTVGNTFLHLNEHGCTIVKVGRSDLWVMRVFIWLDLTVCYVRLGMLSCWVAMRKI